MVSDTDKKELEEHFSKQYVLIPKNRVYHVAGGILGVLVLGLGISYQAVLKVLESEMANNARQNIMAVEKNVTEAQQRIDGLERAAKTDAEWLHSTAVQESNLFKQRIAEAEQARKEAAEKLAATTIESLQAKKIAIVDKDGKTKLLLATTQTGNGFLSVYDSNDTERLRIAEDKNGYVGLWLKDRDNNYRMRLMTDSKGFPLLYLNDSTKKKRLQLYENEDGYAGIRLMDRDGNYRMILTTDSEGLPALYLHDSTKKKRLQLYEDEGGYAGLALIDRTNKSRMKLMTEPEAGLPALEMYDDKGAIMSQSPHLPPSAAPHQ